jgi:hypothetical protein
VILHLPRGGINAFLRIRCATARGGVSRLLSISPRYCAGRREPPSFDFAALLRGAA